jgi:ABC-type amino acid transport substrate-binding protein
VHRVPVAQEASGATPVLQSIRQRGVLRVGYMEDALPYAFFNAKGDLVGLDVELAHRLATELGVSVAFMPIDREHLVDELGRDCCDIVMAGVAVTTRRAADVLFSATYLDETFGFVVPDHSRALFSSWEAIQRLTPLTIAVPDVPYYIDKLRRTVPHARLRVVHHPISRMFDEWEPDVDALAIPAERGSAWTLLHPKFSVVVPEPGIMRVPLAYPIGRNDPAFVSFINTWIDLKRKDGTIQSLYDYWVQGRDASPRRPRWSIIRDVLHWTE